MDSFLSFGLCEKALEFNVEAEFPNQSKKTYQFHSRFTVDKIKTCIFQDLASNLNKQDYTLSIENEQLMVDFVRFIVANPKITETLASEPIVKIQVILKQSSSSSSLNIHREKVNLGTTNMNELKSNLEKSPIVTRLAGGGRLSGNPDTLAQNIKLLKKYREEEEEKREKREEKEKKKEEKEKRKEDKERSTSSPSLVGGVRPDRSSSSGSITPLTRENSYNSSGSGAASDVESDGGNDCINQQSSVNKYATLSFKNILGGKPRIKSFLNLGSGKKGAQKAHSSSDDLSFASVQMSPPASRPKTQEYSSINQQQQQVDHQVNESIEQIKDFSLISNTKGFVVESYRKGLTNNPCILDQLITNESWYLKYFFGNEHFTYIGEDEKNGPFVLSCIKDTLSSLCDKSPNSSSLNLSSSDVIVSVDGTSSSPSSPSSPSSSSSSLSSPSSKKSNNNTNSYRVLLRTKSSDIYTVSTSKVFGSFLKSSSNKVPVKEILQNIAPDLSTKSIRQVKSQDIHKELLSFEEKQRIKSFKFGVLYCAPNQSTEEEMFSNGNGSEEFNEFLTILGDRVKLQGWSNYRGGLDVKSNTTGMESVYKKYQEFEIMYHVSTLLPHSTVDTQQVEKKRHIGNDIVVIIFKESDKPLCPNTFQSDFNHVFIVVSIDKQQLNKNGQKRYKVSISYKEGVTQSSPYLEYPCQFVNCQDFSNFLLCKFINSECSSYDAPSFKIKIQRTRVALLKNIIESHSKE